MYRLLHIPSTIWSNHVHSRHFSHYGFSIYPFPSAFHSMTVLQVASQFFISVIACILVMMYTCKGLEPWAKFYFMGDIWHLGKKYLQNLK
jgi:hypothetical protein